MISCPACAEFLPGPDCPCPVCGRSVNDAVLSSPGRDAILDVIDFDLDEVVQAFFEQAIRPSDRRCPAEVLPTHCSRCGVALGSGAVTVADVGGAEVLAYHPECLGIALIPNSELRPDGGRRR